MVNLFILAQKQYPFQAHKYGNFYQVTLKVQKILTSSNQILDLGSLRLLKKKKKIILVYKFCFTCSRFLSVYLYLGMFLFVHVRVCMRARAYMRMCYVCVCMRICVRRYACVYLYICMHAFFFHLVYMKLKILLKSYF